MFMQQNTKKINGSFPEDAADKAAETGRESRNNDNRSRYVNIASNSVVFKVVLSCRRGDTRMCQIFPCDVTNSRARVYKRSANAFEEQLWSFVCSGNWKAGELSAIESAVTVIISELLSVCVANLFNSYCSC
ncbi:hypothetical protein AVEN_187717-1 [Araneus ventricosus]|uniref:Uncharacterized protein n=1 Tax=Araneus ventricosus TaxID=182803 RepID=A0A4Y2C3Q9_ARAVE|nr:hypothetical protein AVEN_187717-1 [Araneus ventricosus]